MQDEEFIYDCYAFIVHNGDDSCKSGHYVAYCLDGESVWHEFNDSVVTPMLDEEVVLGCIKDAYMLFYRRRCAEVDADVGAGRCRAALQALQAPACPAMRPCVVFTCSQPLDHTEIDGCLAALLGQHACPQQA